MTAIIILNWNGADDTLACLESLTKAEGSFRAYVVDNGSSDDSVQRIGEWLEGHPAFDGRLVPLDKNYGFARGNNKGVAVARKDSPDSYLLLNNDTEVMPDFLTALQHFASEHPQYRVLTPQINYFYDKHKVWNCGGKLRFGFRKYYYAGQPDSAIKEKEYIPISFITGCALYFYPELLDDEGRLLTERFFFGEEDFELSFRLNKKNVQMACVLESLIYHKVGASGNKMSSIGKLYMHYLNRFIDVRLHMGGISFCIWNLLNIPLLIRYFYRGTRNMMLTLRLVWQLLIECRKKEGVTHDDFNSLVLNNNYFSFKV